MPSTTLTITLELEIDVSGDIEPAEPSVGIMVDQIGNINIETVRFNSQPVSPLALTVLEELIIGDINANDTITDALMDAR